MRKDIYIIKNNINAKVYIGQSVDSKKRFQSHCKPSAAIRDNELIAKAIQKYGREHFWYEILEEQIENYNEKEKYYIQAYNSLVPNGYNLLKGGDAPPKLPGASHPEAKLTEEQVEELTKDLRDNLLSTGEIVNKYGFKSRTSIYEFNNGRTYYRSNIEYPIREDLRIGKLTEKDVDEIIHLLKTTDYTYKKIADKFNMEYKAISRIDKGILHKRKDEKYPIRSR